MSKIIKQSDLKKKKAIELLAHEPDMNLEQLAKEVGVCRATIHNWRSDPGFIDAFYDRYMVLFGSELPSVLKSLIREAKEGNVQAARLVLEHSGKLVKRVSVKIDSPFEKFLNAVEGEVLDVNEIDDLDQQIEKVGESPIDIINSIEVDENLPERNKENDKPKARLYKEKKKIKKIKNKSKYTEKKTKEKYQSMYQLRKRAIKVGLDLLPPKKPTKTERANWIAKLEELEAKNSEK